MRPSDKKLVAFPGAAPPARERDPRIDVFRGIALLMILVDHIPGNPYEALTIRNFGFSDAAEGFFLMSGIAAGIAYSGNIERWRDGRGSIGAAGGPIWRRAWTLYLVQLFMTLWALAMFAGAAQLFVQPDLIEQHNISRMFETPLAAFPGLAALTYQVGYVNILPTYIVLLLVTPFVLRAGLRAPWFVLGAATLVWFAGGGRAGTCPTVPAEAAGSSARSPGR
ncbi:OpgC protein [Salipiger mucosus DSM 16094]|uniref:OpgC protein n=1 Tax=Salipiger mucosus DSM 16094 TaxID=1123237 RepID=S9QFS3_9RHOB|nr:OpgC domain-containing protein [Salipiger mucosus]EPX78727.1 OpgC protein [Salipiger mucosus DSM 16094]